jgi:hypothetical protein
VLGYWEHFGEHIDSLGTHLEDIIGNLVGTPKSKYYLEPHHNTHPPTQEKIPNSTVVLFEPSHWFHGIFIPKMVCDLFWPGIIPLPNKVGS